MTHRWRRIGSVLFPGARWVWIGALVVLALATVFFARLLSARTADLTGTNSVDVAAVIAHADPGQPTCIRDLVIPRGTGRVEVWMGGVQLRRGAQVRARIQAPGVRLRLEPRGPPPVAGFTPLEVPRPLTAELDDAAVCLTPRRMALDFGGASVQRLPGAAVTTVAGAPLQGVDIGVRFLRPEGEAPRVVEALPDALRRATLFESPAGTVLLWLALPALLALAYLVVRVAATADGRSVRRLAAAAAVVAFVHGAAWAVLLHPFHGADESEHFAYAQHLAATGERADAAQTSTRPPYSSSQQRLLEALHHNSTVLNPSSRLRWEDEYESAYRRAARDTSDRDGGGYTESASGHSPLYYAVVGMPYRVLGGVSDLPGVLLAMRLLNALLAAGVAGLAVLTAACLFGAANRAVAWLAGVLAGLQPVFGSVAGAVNNDTAVNLMAAGLIYLLVRTWAEGPRPRAAVVAGVLAALLPVAKITGFAVLGLLPLALVLVAVRHGLRPAARWGATALATAAVLAAAWVFVIAPLTGGTRGSIVNVHPAAPAAAGTPAPPAPVAAADPSPLQIRTRTEYLLQTVLPWPQIGADRWQLPGTGPFDAWPLYAIYVVRGYGLFGWKSAELSENVLPGVLIALVAGWLLVVVAAVRHRRHWRRWAGGAAILATAIVAVLALVAFGYATTAVRTEPGEQGRYAFPALVALSVLFSAAVLAFRDRLQQLAVGVGVAAAGMLALVAWTGALRSWFM